MPTLTHINPLPGMQLCGRPFWYGSWWIRPQVLAGEQSDTFAFFAILADENNTWMRVTSHTPHTHRVPSLSTHQDAAGELTCEQSGAAGYTAPYVVRFNPAGTKCYVSQFVNFATSYPMVALPPAPMQPELLPSGGSTSTRRGPSPTL